MVFFITPRIYDIFFYLFIYIFTENQIWEWDRQNCQKD